MASKSLKEIAELVGGYVVGDDSTLITNALPPRDAEPGCLALVDGDRERKTLADLPAAAILVREAIECELPQLIVTDPRDVFAKLIMLFRPARSTAEDGIHPAATIDPTAEIEDNVSIGPGATVGPGVVIGSGTRIEAGAHVQSDCKLGRDCKLSNGVVLYPDSILGDRVVIHAGTVIGADGFGYTLVNGQHTKAAQLGWVQIGDDVEIGANTAVDRGAFGATRIGNGTKIDNFVQIAHNCHIGEHNLICAHVGISGSVTTGKYVVLAGQVGIADHTVVADRVVVGAQSGIIGDVTEGITLIGSPAVPRREKLQQVILTARLPQMQKDLKRMRKELDTLQEQQSAADSAADGKTAHPNGGQGQVPDETKDRPSDEQRPAA